VPRADKPLTGYRPHWAKRFGPAPFLPMSRAEMDALGWDSCDIVIVTGDAYVDHPSFGMAVIGRTLEAQGFRVGIIAQPDWQTADPFKALGKPNLFYGVAAGNMDSMINRYTADRKIRSDDAYTPGGLGGKRPDRASLVYAQRCKEAYPEVPIIMGGIEASLRRIAHYDYWQDKVRRSMVVDAKCDLLLYGNAERAIIEVAHRLAAGENVRRMTDIRGTAFVRRPGRRRLVRDRLQLGRPGRSRRRTHQPLPDHRRTGGRARQHLLEGGGRRRTGSSRPGRRPRIGLQDHHLRRPAQAHRPHQDAAARQERDPPAQLRAGSQRPGAVRPRQPRAAPRDQPRQRPRPGAAPRRRQHRARRLDQPAADPAVHARDGPRVRPAVRPQPAPGLCRRTRRP